jgi:tetratricopeptide (TPR) repeat protein
LKTLVPAPTRKAAFFSHFDQLHLKAAESWLQFGNWQEATEALQLLPQESHAHPDVLELHLKIYTETSRWGKVVEVARTMTQMWPENEWGYFHLAFALHQLKRTAEAYQTAIQVVNVFPANYLMRYNLACYACRLGRFTEALMWLEDAFDRAGGAELRAMAAGDADLRPLWGEMV